MKRYICSIVTILTVAISIYAQSAEKIDGILESEKITAGHASYLILTALDAIPDDADFELAFSKMQENRWPPKVKTADDILSFKKYAFLLMKAFDIKGGMLYRIYPCPRYAYRDLRYLSIIQGKTDPDMPVSGTAALQMIGRIETVKGAQ